MFQHKDSITANDIVEALNNLDPHDVVKFKDSGFLHFINDLFGRRTDGIGVIMAEVTPDGKITFKRTFGRTIVVNHGQLTEY